MAYASPGSDAGCGLKQRSPHEVFNQNLRITRQRCRVRIETPYPVAEINGNHASPGSDAGCGLKHIE